MKSIATITLLMLGSAALAQPDNTAWIEDCGSIRANNFGTEACDVAEMATLFQSLDVAYFEALDTGVDNGAMAGGFRLLGAALAQPEVQNGECSGAGYGLVMKAAEFLNTISLPDADMPAQRAMTLSLGNVAEAGAEYVMKGCR